MSYQPQQPCPQCGRVLRDDDREGSTWECRHCRTSHHLGEVVL